MLEATSDRPGGRRRGAQPQDTSNILLPKIGLNTKFCVSVLASNTEKT